MYHCMIHYHEFVCLFQRRAADAGHYAGKVDGAPRKMTLAALDHVPPPAGDNIPDAGDAKLNGVHNVLVGVGPPGLAQVPGALHRHQGAAVQDRAGRAGRGRGQQDDGQPPPDRPCRGPVAAGPADPEAAAPDAAFKRGSPEARAASAALWSGLRAIAATVKEVAREQGVQVEWGGDWKWDAPHFQLNHAAYPA